MRWRLHEPVNLILIHGIVGFHGLFREGYLRPLGDHLSRAFNAMPLRVFETHAEPLSGIVSRGPLLRKQILDAFARGELDPKAPTHIFAHSMGGLDARYLLSPANPNNLGERIASLTQIGVPNRGTPIVDFLVGEWRQHPVQDVIEKLSQTALLLLRAIQVDAEGIQDLTRDDLLAFNDTYTDHPQVNYHSVAGVGRGGWRATSRVILPLHQITTALSGERNDGLVPLSSARWGPVVAEEWPADHADLVGINMNFPFVRPLHFDVYGRYKKLIERRAQET
jgi:triacylglycerol lipase